MDEKKDPASQAKSISRIFRDGDHKIRFYDSDSNMVQCVSDRSEIDYNENNGVFEVYRLSTDAKPFYFRIDTLTQVDLDGTKTDYGTSGPYGFAEPTIDYEEVVEKSRLVFAQLAADVFFECCPSAGGGGAVDSVFGRTGVVVAATSDYDASQVDNDSGVSGATVADALNALAAAGGGGKFIQTFSFQVSPGVATRFYAGDSSGGVNDPVWAHQRDPWSIFNRGVDLIRGGFICPFEVTNLRFQAKFYSSGSPSGDVTWRLFKVAPPANGDSFTDTYTQTALCDDAVTISAGNTLYIAEDTTNTSGCDAGDYLVIGLESVPTGVILYCNVTVYGDIV